MVCLRFLLVGLFIKLTCTCTWQRAEAKGRWTCTFACELVLPSEGLRSLLLVLVLGAAARSRQCRRAVCIARWSQQTGEDGIEQRVPARRDRAMQRLRQSQGGGDPMGMRVQAGCRGSQSIAINDTQVFIFATKHSFSPSWFSFNADKLRLT